MTMHQSVRNGQDGRSYDTRAGGYRIDMSRHDLRSAPSFDRDTEPRFDRSYGDRVHDYYGLNY